MNSELSADRKRTHGLYGTPEYTTWQSMKARCCNPKDKRFVAYGGRGITVCDRWRNSFEAFLTDMGKRPSYSHSLDRIDVDGAYEPGNCRWATKIQQANNTRFNRKLTYQGETRTVAEWARITGISCSTLLNRLILGWPDEVALSIGCDGRTTPGRNQRQRQSTIRRGIKLTPREVCAIRARHAEGVSYSTIAKEFGLSIATCFQIVHRQIWKHVP